MNVALGLTLAASAGVFYYLKNDEKALSSLYSLVKLVKREPTPPPPKPKHEQDLETIQYMIREFMLICSALRSALDLPHFSDNDLKEGLENPVGNVLIANLHVTFMNSMHWGEQHITTETWQDALRNEFKNHTSWNPMQTDAGEPIVYEDISAKIRMCVLWEMGRLLRDEQTQGDEGDQQAPSGSRRRGAIDEELTAHPKKKRRIEGNYNSNSSSSNSSTSDSALSNNDDGVTDSSTTDITTLSLPSEGPKTGITLMLVSHSKMTQLFKKLLKCTTYEGKMKLKSNLITAVSKHILTEEQVIYPTVSIVSPDSKEDVNRSVEQGSKLKDNLLIMKKMDSFDSRFEVVVNDTNTRLRKLKEHEEKNLFPVLETTLSKNELSCMADLIIILYKIAPSCPDPYEWMRIGIGMNPIVDMGAGPLDSYYHMIRNSHGLEGPNENEGDP